jgi:hypothetical protein
MNFRIQIIGTHQQLILTSTIQQQVLPNQSFTRQNPLTTHPISNQLLPTKTLGRRILRLQEVGIGIRGDAREN